MRDCNSPKITIIEIAIPPSLELLPTSAHLYNKDNMVLKHVLKNKVVSSTRHWSLPTSKCSLKGSYHYFRCPAAAALDPLACAARKKSPMNFRGSLGRDSLRHLTRINGERRNEGREGKRARGRLVE